MKQLGVIIRSGEEREFWRWVNPNNFFEAHNIQITGSLYSNPVPDDNALMFMPNPEFEGPISNYQNNIIRRYVAEYNLEIDRRRWYEHFPSRLSALYLFECKEEAELYNKLNEGHCKNRVLKRCVSHGPYIFSMHDQSWFEFATAGHSMSTEDINNLSHAYWRGERVEDNELMSMGKRWEKESVMEVLFLGRVSFPNKDLISDE